MGNQVICHLCYNRSPTPHESKRINLLLVGLDNAGKTTAAKGLAGEPVLDPAPTLGFSRLVLRRRGWTVELYDVGGGRGIRGIWRNYLAECHGLVFVVDASDPGRADESRQTLHALLEDHRVRGKPVLLLANKQDVPSALDEVELNERLQLEAAANQHRCPMRIELCSAKLCGQNGKKRHLAVATGFNWLCDYVIENHAALESRVSADLAERAAELERQRRARDERVRRSREAAAAAADTGEPDEAAPSAAPSAVPPEQSAAEPDDDEAEPRTPAAEVAPPAGSCPASPGGPPASPTPPDSPDTPLNAELEAQIEEVFTRTEMGRRVRDRGKAAEADGGGDGEAPDVRPPADAAHTNDRVSAQQLIESPAQEKDSGQGSTKESDSEALTSSNASQLSGMVNGIERPRKRNRFFKRYTKTAPMPDDVRVTSVPSTPPTLNQ